MRNLGLAVLFAVAQTFAIPAQAVWIFSNVTSSSFNFIQDGTSNTIQFGENSRGAFCFNNVTIPVTITDGTSNTILLSEDTGFRFTPHTVSGGLPFQQFFGDGSVRTLTPADGTVCLGDVQLGNVFTPGIADGTSNTIIVGENTRFDACFNDVNLFTFGDGSVRTLSPNQKGLCYKDVAVKGDISTVDPLDLPEPFSFLLLGSGLILIGLGQRRYGRPM